MTAVFRTHFGLDHPYFGRLRVDVHRFEPVVFLDADGGRCEAVGAAIGLRGARPGLIVLVPAEGRRRVLACPDIERWIHQFGVGRSQDAIPFDKDQDGEDGIDPRPGRLGS